MSIRLMTEAMETSLACTHKMVMVVVCDFADDAGRNCWPAISTIAYKASISERQAQRVMADLGQMNLLSVVGKNQNGGRGMSRHYQVHVQNLSGLAQQAREKRALEQLEKGDMVSPFMGVDNSLKGDMDVTLSEPKRVTSETERVTSTTQKGDTHVTQAVINHHLKHPSGEAREVAGDNSNEDFPFPKKPDPLKCDTLQPFPEDWRPCAETSRILAVRKKPMPAVWVIDAFAAHWTGKLIAPRRIPNEFLKWVCRQQGMNRGKVPTDADSADVMQAASAAWAEVRAANQREQMPDGGWSDPRTKQALEAIGGFRLLRDMRVDQVPYRQKEFINAFSAAGGSNAQ